MWVTAVLRRRHPHLVRPASDDRPTNSGDLVDLEATYGCGLRTLNGFRANIA